MDELIIAGKKFKSRLITGTGKHRSSEDLLSSIKSSETEMITVAIRRINFDDPKEPEYDIYKFTRGVEIKN